MPNKSGEVQYTDGAKCKLDKIARKFDIGRNYFCASLMTIKLHNYSYCIFLFVLVKKGTKSMWRKDRYNFNCPQKIISRDSIIHQNCLARLFLHATVVLQTDI